MAISFPVDLFDGFPGWTTDFEPLYRQEQSRTAGGRTIVKDFGSPLWVLTAQSRSMRPSELDYWRAKLAALENGIGTFRAYPMSRRYPILYPNGNWPTGGAFSGTTATLHTIESNRVSIRVGNLPVGFTLTVGDYISVNNRDLHQVMETATADGGGLSSLFEVRPKIWSDIAETSPLTGVSVKNPSCIMAIVPGSITSSSDRSNGIGALAFRAIEAR